MGTIRQRHRIQVKECLTVYPKHGGVLDIDHVSKNRQFLLLTPLAYGHPGMRGRELSAKVRIGVPGHSCLFLNS